MKAPFPIDPVLTAIAIAYKNEEYVADQVLPRITVGRSEFKWRKYDLGEAFRIPDTKVGRRGRPSEVEFTYTEETGSVKDYGLDDPIPQSDIDNAAGTPYNPVSNATERLTDLILLDREARVATKVFDINNYPSAQRTTLSGTSQWSDPTSSPLDAVLTALDAMIIRANTLVIGQAVWTKLKRHPKLVKAMHGNSGDEGAVTKAFLAELLEIQRVVVGAGWKATSKEGQTVAMARLWGKHAALLNINPNAGAGNVPTFGFTAQWGSRVAGSRPDPDIGLRGGTRVRSGESVEEVICASDMGYFFADAVA